MPIRMRMPVPTLRTQLALLLIPAVAGPSILILLVSTPPFGYLAAGASLLLTGIAAALISRKLLRPLARLSSATEGISVDGALHRIEVGDEPEFASIGDRINLLIR